MDNEREGERVRERWPGKVRENEGERKVKGAKEKEKE